MTDSAGSKAPDGWLESDQPDLFFELVEDQQLGFARVF